MKVLVTGGRAKTGAPLVDLLLESGQAEVLAGTSNPDSMAESAATAVRFSWDAPESWPAAVDGVDAVYVVRPELEHAPELLTEFLEHVPEGAHVVVLSEEGAGDADEDAWAARYERAAREAAQRTSFVRPGWFSQVFADDRFLTQLPLQTGVLAFPGNDQPVSWIDARDIAAVAAAVILGKARTGEAYDITGGQAPTFTEVAALMSSVAGSGVVYREISIDEAAGEAEGFARESLIGAIEAVAAGQASTVTDTVQRVLGRPPRTVEDYLRDHLAGTA